MSLAGSFSCRWPPWGESGVIEYTYDVVGNREQRLSTIPALTSTQTLNFSENDWLTNNVYDDNGNTLESSAGTDTYDWRNRLIRRVEDSGRTIDITYNAMGDRVMKSINGTDEVHYLVDRNNLTGYAQVLEELVESNSSLTVERVYTYGLDLISQNQLIPPGALEAWLSGTGPEPEWQLSYYLYDGLGTVRALAGANGIVTDAYFYDAYGVLLNAVGTTPNAYLYTGEQFDADLGMYFLRARYMNPETGRFWIMDTYEGRGVDPATLHKYLYVHGNPVMGVDPSGQSWLSDLTMSLFVRGILFLSSASPAAVLVKSTLGALTIAAAVHDPGAFVSAFDSPGAAFEVLAMDVRFLVLMGSRIPNGIRFLVGAVNANSVKNSAMSLLRSIASRIKSLDDSALIGIRGSVVKGQKGPHKDNAAFNVDDFDVDAFIVSDKIASRIRRRGGGRWGSDDPDIAAISDDLEDLLREEFPGLREDGFEFKIYTQREFVSDTKRFVEQPWEGTQ